MKHDPASGPWSSVWEVAASHEKQLSWPRPDAASSSSCRSLLPYLSLVEQDELVISSLTRRKYPLVESVSLS